MEFGRHARLRPWCPKGRVGSTPTAATNRKDKEQMIIQMKKMKFIKLKNKYCPIRTCAHCEFTYWGRLRADKSCPKCDFAHYGAAFVYDSWFRALFELITNNTYNKKKKVWDDEIGYLKAVEKWADSSHVFFDEYL